MRIHYQRLVTLFFLVVSLSGKSQQNNLELFRNIEDSCVWYYKQLSSDLPDSDNLAINTRLTDKLVSLLKTPGSFDYPLDSLKSFGRIYAPDKSFRIITWNVALGSGVFRYYGFIQVPFSNSYKIFRLIDRSDEVPDPENSVLSAGKWYGALYYKMLKEKVDNRTYYTLLALQYHNMAITRKMVEILYFDEYGNPVFGAPIIQVNKKMKHRLVFVYSALSSVNLKYDEKRKMIIFDHVAPAEPQYAGQYEYYGPDLTFDGLVFKKGFWIYTPNLDLRQSFDPSPKHKPIR
ncbi:MAG TPA: hypothetical protein VIH57_04445 [Bacteroidales bacterium]